MITLDANILVYAADTRDLKKHRAAVDILAAASSVSCTLGLQAIGEFYVVCTRKLGIPRGIVQEQVQNLLSTFNVFQHTRAAISKAAILAGQGRFFFWDAVLLSSAEEAGCLAMLSEDMADGGKFGGLTVHNPFARGGMSDAARRLLQL